MGMAIPMALDHLKCPTLILLKMIPGATSLNGKQFLIPQGSSYTVVADSFGTTIAKIIGGTNKSTTTDLTPVGYSTDGTQVSVPRPLNRAVNTGWVANPNANKLKSDILSLWGMSEFGANGQTDIYVFSMSFNP
jgi:hypothetical protein